MYDQPKQKSVWVQAPQTHVEIIAQGSIDPPIQQKPLQDEQELVRAPVSMRDVSMMEQDDGMYSGEYFVQLMKHRLELILSIQHKWHMRACNQKHPRHVQVQQEITDFMASVTKSFDEKFSCRPCSGPMRLRTKRPSSKTSSSSSPSTARPIKTTQ